MARKEFTKNDFEEFYDMFHTRMVFLYGDLFENSAYIDPFEINESLGYVLEEAIKGNLDEKQILKEAWGYTCWLSWQLKQKNEK